MENSFKLLVPDKGGRYRVVRPNFELMNLEKTSDSVNAGCLVPFGFLFTHEHTELFLSEKNHSESHDIVKKNAFKKAYEKLERKREESGADYILIDDFECSNGSSESCHITIKQCLFLVFIAHIPNTVYKI